MRVLVTGAGGFIGRQVVKGARARGWEVTGVARRPCPEADRIADLRETIEDWPAPDAVIHLAGAYAGCGPRELAETDLRIARNLLAGDRRAAFAGGCSQARPRSTARSPARPMRVGRAVR